MSKHERMKRIGHWVYCDGHLYNTNSRDLVEVAELRREDISRSFLDSDEFAQIFADQPKIVFKEVEHHQIIALEITDRCNYACGYCFEGSSRCNTGVLDFEVACREIDKLPSGSELRFFGGEPLLEFKLIQRLVEKYPGYKYSLVTNGSLITAEIATFISDHAISVGISYDGAFWQDSNRPSPSGSSKRDFDQGIELLNSAGVRPGISTVITRESIPHLYDIHLEVFDEYPISSWAYLLAYSIDMSTKDLDLFREGLLDIVQGFPALHLLRINDLSKWTLKITGEWPTESFCGAGVSYSALSSSGETKYCAFFLRESSCYGPSIGAVEVDCKKCSIWNFCHGGCLALNLYGSGSTHLSHPFSCKKNNIYFEAGLKTRIKVKQELESRRTHATPQPCSKCAQGRE